MLRTDQTVTIGGVPHYLTRAAAPATAGVLLLPHAPGIDAFVRDFADRLAARGLPSVAWNPYPDLPMGATFEKRPAKPADGAAVEMMSKCIDFMHAELGAQRIAAIGFCMGGRYALLLGAKEPRLNAAVAAYPSIPAELAPGQDTDPVVAAASIACPVQLLYPGRDHITSRAVFEKLQTNLEARSAPTAIQIYPDAEHGFMHAKGEHNALATRRARPQIDGFVEAYLTVTAGSE